MISAFQLEDFALLRMNVDFNVLEKKGHLDKPASESIAFDLEFATNLKDKDRYRVVLHLWCRQETEGGEPCGFAIESRILGIVNFPSEQEADEIKRDSLIKLNSISILYGLIRGMIANATGAFPARKYVLPAIMPQDILQMVADTKSSISSKEEGKPDKKKKAASAVKPSK
jgi:preprotein translocase subunit SecB